MDEVETPSGEVVVHGAEYTAADNPKEGPMKRFQIVIAIVMVLGVGLALIGARTLSAQSPPVKRTDLVKAELTAMDNPVAYLWVGELAPGAATGKHAHPTPRFVYVLEGAVTVEIDGQSPATYKAGEAFQESPNVAHNFRNASATHPARALGFQVATKGQPLQY
jgi:quercetin dioxygenase-like cupin family protein